MRDLAALCVTVFCCLFGSGGLVMWLLERSAKRRDGRMEEIKEGIRLGLENDAVIFKALREHRINGGAETQERKMNEYFRKAFLE